MCTAISRHELGSIVDANTRDYDFIPLILPAHSVKLFPQKLLFELLFKGELNWAGVES